MNIKIGLIFLLTLVIIAGAPTSLAKNQYLTNLTAVYGNGSCGTCHVNGNNDGLRTSYGTLFENQPNHTANPSAALLSVGAPPTANPTLTPIAILTPVVTTVSATNTPVAPIETAAVTTTVSTKATPAAPGFGFVLSLIGLIAWSLLAKRKNK